MTIGLYNGSKDCVGLMSSGGTESIFLATHSYREEGKQKGITTPNVVTSVTAHCGLDKACHYLGIELRKVPLVKGTLKFDIEGVEKLIDKNTIFIYASSPEYAFGNYDPISKIGALC